MDKLIYCPLDCKALLDMSVQPIGENERVQFGCLAYVEPIRWRDDGILKVQKCLDKRKPPKGWRLKQEGDGLERMI